jgi:multidrug efflux pump subunit AcrA (membrane-fusion protein)
VLAAVVVGLTTVKTDFTVEAEGELQPARMQHVFAPRRGVVTRLMAQGDQAVVSDDVLLELRDPELDLEFQRLRGEIQTTAQRLSATESARVQAVATADPAANGRLSAEEEELKLKLASFREQHATLEQQQQQLVVRSPIAGKVLTWDLQERLEARPVERGQHLLTVGDPQSQWTFRVFISESAAGHVLDAAQRTDGHRLPVSYVLATDPSQTWRGELRHLSTAAEARSADSLERSIQAQVHLESQTVSGLRPGATARVRIHCGTKSWGFVLFHELYETLRTKLFPWL